MRYKHIMMSFWVCMPLCILLRVLQIVFMVEDGTGFAEQPYFEFSFIIMLVIFAATGVVTALAATVRRCPKHPPRVNPLIGLTSMALGSVIIYELVSSSETSAGWQKMLLIVFGFAASAFFMAYGVKALYNYPLPRMLYIVPVLYWVVKLICVFTNVSSLALISDNVFLLLTYCAVLLFMLEFAKVANKVDREISFKNLLASGLAATMLCSATALPRLMVAVLNSSVVMHSDISSLLMTAFTGAFIFSFVISHFDGKNLSHRKHRRSENEEKFLPVEDDSDAYYTGNKESNP